MFLSTMAHNPPRPKSLDHKAIAEVARAVANRRQWIDLDDLADKMLARAAQGKNVVLSPGTAEFVGRWIKSKNNCR